MFCLGALEGDEPLTVRVGKHGGRQVSSRGSKLRAHFLNAKRRVKRELEMV